MAMLLVLCSVLIVLPITIALIAGKTAGRQAKRTNGRVPCPFCAELIQPGAKICRFCGRDLPSGPK